MLRSHLQQFDTIPDHFICIEVVNMSWLLGSRNCVGMTRPIDTHMYSREIMTPPQITAIRGSPFAFLRDDTPMEFCSFYDMHMSTRLTRPPEVLAPATIMRNNERIENGIIYETGCIIASGTCLATRIIVLSTAMARTPSESLLTRP
jgi:hypothetical protein